METGKNSVWETIKNEGKELCEATRYLLKQFWISIKDLFSFNRKTFNASKREDSASIKKEKNVEMV